MRHQAARGPGRGFQAARAAVHSFHQAAIGDHDENISYERCVELVGEDIASQLRDLSLKIYTAAAEYAATRGIIIADTKFEFGIIDGKVTLIDECLTPDSSRFCLPTPMKRQGPAQL